METRTLKYFLAIAREENMTAAARNLHVSQSALSRQIADLEEELGKTLFTRTNRQMILTADGMHLRQRAEEIIELIEKTEMEFRASDEDISGEIHIGAGETRGFSLIAHAIKATQEKYPGIHFSIYSANALDVAERLEHGTLDFGLMFEPLNHERYITLSLPYSDKLGLLVRKEDPLAQKEHITEQDLHNIPLLVSSRLSPDYVLSQMTQTNTGALDVRGTYNLIYNASLMVEQGIGSAITINGLVNTSVDSPFRFIPLKPEVTMNLVFVWKKYHLLTKAGEVFWQELKNVCEHIND